jgi:hypothetical protein
MDQKTGDKILVDTLNVNVWDPSCRSERCEFDFDSD